MVSLALVAGLGCRGTISEPGVTPGDPSGPGGGEGGACDAASLHVPDTPLRRLSHTELRFTLRDLFAGVALPEVDLIGDPRIYGFENNADALAPNAVLVEQYDRAAVDVARRVVSAPADVRARALGCWADTPDAERDCGRTIIADLGRRAFRRPLTAEEQGRYRDLFDAQHMAHGFEVAVRLLLEAMLQAPQVLYRLELGNPAESDGELVALTDHELATRLSYLLWSSTPDEELLAAADAGALSDEAQLEAQVRRMVDDPKARAAVVDFHRQWLDFGRVEDVNKDSELYPSFGDPLRWAMRDELDRFVEHVVFDGEGTLRALLLDRTTFVDDRLATLYGVELPAEGEVAQRTLPADQRAGILTRAAFLTSHAHQQTGSPPLRGVFVLRRMLCAEIGAPPPNADTTAPVLTPEQTNREAFEARTASATCQSCHHAINGVGFTFEHYDAIGAFREVDNGRPVDASGWLTDTDVDGAVDGPVALSERLSESAVVERCATLSWFRYAEGRDAAPSETCEVDALADVFAESGGDVRELMVALAMRPELRYRAATDGETR
ncbi:MAG TPA: DUF1592 domain-containing protein [Sandaracinaceae bacterium LLY-WYZ-13_1]|nr:DUF1592 domain-containing protein [Sandaracinaceae bacterium LLY-WYZ-13_1]